MFGIPLPYIALASVENAPAAPDASAKTESFVLVSPSIEMR